MNYSQRLRLWRIAATVLFSAFLPTALAEPVDVGRRVDRIEFVNLRRTDPEWLSEYLALDLPVVLTVADLRRLESKIMTTGVFWGAKCVLEPELGGSGDKLVVKLDEKWTAIPVVRGQFGGGTPLGIVGFYNAHSFGKLWTLGAELRRYGTSPVGYVAWAKAPRWLDGNWFLDFEAWRLYRERQVFDKDYEQVGSFLSSATILRAQALMPMRVGVPIGDLEPWRVGLDIVSRYEIPPSFRPEPGRTFADTDKKFRLLAEKSTEVTPYAVMIYDNVRVKDVDYDGLRVIGRFGRVLSQESVPKTKFEHETFAYRLFADDWNVALHWFVGGSDSEQLSQVYFLGGFDSVRGLPDGVLSGNKAAYINTEVRKIAYRWPTVWLQPTVFLDRGGASSISWDDMRGSSRSAAGIGVRIIVPQVYRLILRIDYGWSVDGERPSQGLSVGLNELFQPYPPL